MLTFKKRQYLPIAPRGGLKVQTTLYHQSATTCIVYVCLTFALRLSPKVSSFLYILFPIKVSSKIIMQLFWKSKSQFKEILYINFVSLSLTQKWIHVNQQLSLYSWVRCKLIVKNSTHRDSFEIGDALELILDRKLTCNTHVCTSINFSVKAQLL